MKPSDCSRAERSASLERVEGLCPNLYDWGTHWFDMMNFLNGDEPAEWVMGQLERRGGASVFDVEMEGQGLSQFRYRNGVQGLLTTGTTTSWECWIKLTGSEGRMVVSVSHEPALRLWGSGHSGWRSVDVPNEGSDIDKPVTLAMLDLLDALENRREPELSGRRALKASELIFATYESSRRRGRVDLPLTAEDNAYHALLARAARWIEVEADREPPRSGRRRPVSRLQRLGARRTGGPAPTPEQGPPPLSAAPPARLSRRRSQEGGSSARAGAHERFERRFPGRHRPAALFERQGAGP